MFCKCVINRIWNKTQIKQSWKNNGSCKWFSFQKGTTKDKNSFVCLTLFMLSLSCHESKYKNNWRDHSSRRRLIKDFHDKKLIITNRGNQLPFNFFFKFCFRFFLILASLLLSVLITISKFENDTSIQEGVYYLVRMVYYFFL